MNTGDPWPDFYESEQRVLGMQTKLHQWTMADPGRRFDDVFNLVYDPATPCRFSMIADDGNL